MSDTREMDSKSQFDVPFPRYTVRTEESAGKTNIVFSLDPAGAWVHITDVERALSGRALPGGGEPAP